MWGCSTFYFLITIYIYLNVHQSDKKADLIAHELCPLKVIFQVAVNAPLDSLHWCVEKKEKKTHKEFRNMFKNCCHF